MMIERKIKNNTKAEIGYPVLPIILHSTNEFDVHGDWITPVSAAAIWGTKEACGAADRAGVSAAVWESAAGWGTSGLSDVKLPRRRQTPSDCGAPLWNCKAFLSPLSSIGSQVRHEEY
jgi:hypothetical protein